VHNTDPTLNSELATHRAVCSFICTQILELDSDLSRDLLHDMFDDMDPIVILHEEPWYWFLHRIAMKYASGYGQAGHLDGLRLKSIYFALFNVLASFLRGQRTNEQLTKINWAEVRESCNKVVQDHVSSC
jgi:hypothetical protein